MSTDTFRLILLLVALAVVALLAYRVQVVRRALRAERQKREVERAEAATVETAKALVAPRRLTLPELVRRRGPPLVLLPKPLPTRHPILLAHGYFGFASFGVSLARRDYFIGVRERLEALGYTVYLARLSPFGSVNLRAAQLAKQIQDMKTERVNIIAHSMGGIDARYAITCLGVHDRVASLTTVGTPHHGTPLADSSALFIGDWPKIRRMLGAAGANVDGLYDLTTRRMQEFNRLVVNASGVMYSSVVGMINPLGRPVNPLLLPGYTFLSRTVGMNDGMVPVESQKWGDVVGEIEADHWEQIGWSRTFDAQRFYAVLAEHLAEWGL
jgi:triacylglycerol lipase